MIPNLSQPDWLMIISDFSEFLSLLKLDLVLKPFEVPIHYEVEPFFQRDYLLNWLSHLLFGKFSLHSLIQNLVFNELSPKLKLPKPSLLILFGLELSLSFLFLKDFSLSV